MTRKLHPAIALLLCAALSSPTFAKKQVKVAPAAVPQITADQKIEQVLNRLTYGARPGDVERVRQIGLTAFIDQQLHPESLPENPALEAKLAPLETLRMLSSEMVLKYPPSQQIRAMAKGNQPYPTDPETLRVVQRFIDRYKARLAQGKVDPDNVTEDRPAADLEKLGQSLPPAQREIFQNGKPDQKVALLESLSATQQYDILDVMPRGKRQALFTVASPQLRRRIQLLQGGPQQVVNSDLAEGKLFRAVYSNRQLEEVLTDFWYNHFNVFLDKGADRYMVTTYERDVIRPHVLGTFKDLLLATAQSPAMLFYLDNTQSVAPGMDKRPNGKKPSRGLNENYGRELMELHTLGVDGGYTQQDVTEVARCFTGWTIKELRTGGVFQFNERLHDQGEKSVLGVKIPANGGVSDGLKVIDILAHSPATARFISRSLATRFVSDNPTPALVDRMAATFTKTDGDLRATMKTMFEAPEFYTPASFQTKVKSPFEMMASALRATEAQVDFGFALVQQLNTLGEPLYRKVEPTGYSNKGSDWLNSASLLARMNFAVALTNNKVQGTKVDVKPEAAQTLGGPNFQKH